MLLSCPLGGGLEQTGQPSVVVLVRFLMLLKAQKVCEDEHRNTQGHTAYSLELSLLVRADVSLIQVVSCLGCAGIVLLKFLLDHQKDRTRVKSMQSKQPL